MRHMWSHVVVEGNGGATEGSGSCSTRPADGLHTDGPPEEQRNPASRRSAHSLTRRVSSRGATHPAYTDSMASPDIPPIDLMHPTLVTRPFHRSGWVYEEKYDGWRMLVYKRGH